MKHFLISALGSAGDVHPFIAIAQVLVARGHAVELVSAPHFEARIRRAGIDFVPLGAPGDYESLLRRPELWQPRSGARFILDELMRRLPEAHATLDSRVRTTGTVLVGSTLSWGMRLVQERRGLPGATVHLSPVCMPSALAPPVLPGVGDVAWLPTWAVRVLQRAGDRLVIDRLVGPRLDAVRAALGLPPVRRVWSRWMHSPDLVVGAWPDWFAPRQADWPPAARTTGFPLYDEAPLPLDAALASFLDAGAPPVGITAGSAMAHGDALFAGAMDACLALGRRAVLISAHREQLPACLPVGVRHVEYAPFHALLPRLSALVHHGGVGTSAQALAAGIPQVVAPFAHDQFDNAARLRRLGVSTTVFDAASTACWRGAFDDAFSPATGDAVAAWAGRMSGGLGASGAERIADALEALAEGHRGG